MGGKVTPQATGFTAGSRHLWLKGAIPRAPLPLSCHVQGQHHLQMTPQAGLLPTPSPSPSPQWLSVCLTLHNALSPGPRAPRYSSHSQQPTHTQMSSRVLASLR